MIAMNTLKKSDETSLPAMVLIISGGVHLVINMLRDVPVLLIVVAIRMTTMVESHVEVAEIGEVSACILV